MACLTLTSRTTRDDFERMKRLLVRQGDDDYLMRLNAKYHQMTRTTDVPLNNESFFLYVTYPCQDDFKLLADVICKQQGVDDSAPVASLLRRSPSVLVDSYFATLIATWMRVNHIVVDDTLEVDEHMAKQLLNIAWTHAPTHQFATSQLGEAVLCRATFTGKWDTQTLGGTSVHGKSVRDMVREWTYSGEPVFNVLQRLKENRFTSYEKHCASELRVALCDVTKGDQHYRRHNARSLTNQIHRLPGQLFESQ